MTGKQTAQDVKHILHRDVFHPNKERILGFIQVSKTEPGNNPFKKQENVHYLCTYVTSTRPYQAFMARFKKSGEHFERRRQWKLEELKKVDGKKDSSSCLDFDLWFADVFKFHALNLQDKQKFLRELAEACGRYLDRHSPEFVNVSSEIGQIAEKNFSQLEINMQQLNERGEKLSELDQKTSEMAESAKEFAENAHKLAMQQQ